MKVLDYLLIRAPQTRLSTPGNMVSKRRIVLSLVGLLAGIFASFFVTGLRPVGDQAGGPPQEVLASTEASEAAPPSEPTIVGDFSKKRLKVVGLVSLVIVALTYQGLYFALRLYENEPAFLVLFVSFQYGYFWQSAVEGARIVLS